MGALPRPEIAHGPHRALVDALHDLHHRAGWPSLRTLAKDAGCSHTTVSHALSAPKLPAWGIVEVLVEAMNGDVDDFHDLWLAASSTSSGANGTAPSPRIAGRRAELVAVRRHLETGTGLLFVTGEAGIGKTTLVSAAAEPKGATFVATGHCLPLSTAAPLMPIAEALRSIFERDRGQWFAAALADSPDYVAVSLSRLIPELATVSDADTDDEWARHRLFLAIAAALAALAARRPLALVLDDLHWADPMTLDLLEHLAVRGCEVPVLATWRIGPDTSADAAEWWARVRRTPSCTVLPLGPLSREETAEQLRLQIGRVDRETADRIHTLSLGQPLFSEQLAAHGSASDADLPELLSEVLDRRFDDLTPTAWLVARTLGVADRGLPVEVLKSCVRLGIDELSAALGLLDARMLLASVSDDVVQLRHPLLAAAVRHRLDAVDTSEVHRRVARALGERPEEGSAAEIAAHFQAAGEPGPELAWRIKAAATADERFAGAEAAHHWSRVLELWPTGEATVGSPPLTRAQVWLAAMDGKELAGRPIEARALGQRAMAEAAEWPDRDRAEVLRRLAYYDDTIDHVGAGAEPLAEAITIYRRLPVSEGLVHCLDRRAYHLNQWGLVHEAAATLEEARVALEALGPHPLMRALLATIAWQGTRSGRIDEAVAMIADVARMQTSTPEPVLDIWVDLLHTDVLLLACACADQVAAAAARGLHVAAVWGLETRGVQVLRFNVATAWTRAGRIGLAAELVDPLTESVSSTTVSLMHVRRAALDWVRGHDEAARARFDALEGRDGVDLGLLVTERADFEVWHGEPTATLEALSELCQIGSGALQRGETGVPLALAARAAADLAAGSPRAGRRRLELLERVQGLRTALGHDPFSAQALPSDRRAAPQWSAELARLEGADTLAHWNRAITAWDQVARPHDAAYCRWRAAQVALREGQAAAAARLLRRAAIDAREHVPLLAEIRTLGR